MMLGKLYIKISLSFLAVLFITLIIIFMLFIISPGKRFATRLEEQTKEKVMIVKEVVEDKIRFSSIDFRDDESLKDFINIFGEILGAMIWLQEPNGGILLQSFAGEIPPVTLRQNRFKPRDYGYFKLYKPRHSEFYAIIPIEFPDGGKGNLNILFKVKEPPHPESGFALGLFIVGLIISLLIFPISKLIIKPLKKLNNSALKIADGDLSHRADDSGQDEIGELCRSFNFMAEKLEAMIIRGKELTANLSHELRTPLTRIRITEEMLRERIIKGDMGDYEKYLNEIRENISELDNLIDRILKLSKLDIQETILTFEPIEVTSIIKSLLESFQSIILQKGLHISSDLSCEPSFMGDREAFRTALLNILENATKFTPEGGDIIVAIRSKHGFLEISVINTFSPLSEEDLEMIFNPFHRVKGSRATGTGLGLAISKKIIEKHSGTIVARNREKGLEIRITLPGIE